MKIENHHETEMKLVMMKLIMKLRINLDLYKFIKQLRNKLKVDNPEDKTDRRNVHERHIKRHKKNRNTPVDKQHGRKRDRKRHKREHKDDTGINFARISTTTVQIRCRMNFKQIMEPLLFGSIFIFVFGAVALSFIECQPGYRIVQSRSN